MQELPGFIVAVVQAAAVSAGGTTEVQYQMTSAVNKQPSPLLRPVQQPNGTYVSSWVAAGNPGASTSFLYIDGIAEYVSISVRVRAVRPNGVTSDWVSLAGGMTIGRPRPIFPISPSGPAFQFPDGKTLDVLEPAEAGADVTGNNTAKDAANLNGVASHLISPIATLMPAEPGADVTGLNKAADTSAVYGQNAATVAQGATGINVNLIPDSDFKFGSTYWLLGANFYIRQNASGNCMSYEATGSCGRNLATQSIPARQRGGTSCITADVGWQTQCGNAVISVYPGRATVGCSIIHLIKTARYEKRLHVIEQPLVASAGRDSTRAKRYFCWVDSGRRGLPRPSGMRSTRSFASRLETVRPSIVPHLISFASTGITFIAQMYQMPHT